MTAEPNFQGNKPESEGVAKFGMVTPIFNVDDVPASIEYYTKVLGFRVEWDWGERTTFACVRRGEFFLFLCQKGQGKSGTWLWVGVDDVDLLHDEYKKSGAKIVQPPTNFPWGSKEMNVEDLDGHRLRFGSEATGEPDGVPLPE